MSVAGLILAAGRATRFGCDKRQATLPDGRSMLDVVLGLYASVFDTLLLVLPPDDAFGQALAQRHGARTVLNTCPDAGMGASLACGARALIPQAHIGAVVVGLADMPYVQVATLLALRQALSGPQDPVVPVVPAHEGQLGQPRGLPRAHFAALAALAGDEGARHLLHWRTQARVLPVCDPGVLRDVDHPADLLPGDRDEARGPVPSRSAPS